LGSTPTRSSFAKEETSLGKIIGSDLQQTQALRTLARTRKSHATPSIYDTSQNNDQNQQRSPVRPSNVPLINNLPPGCPPPPPNPPFLGGSREAYKEWMRQRRVYESWENELFLYGISERENNTDVCEKIIRRMCIVFGASSDTVPFTAVHMSGVDTSLSSLPPGFPPPPIKVDNFPGPVEDTQAYREWMKQYLLYERWENGLILYKMKESKGDEETCRNIISAITNDSWISYHSRPER